MHYLQTCPNLEMYSDFLRLGKQKTHIKTQSHPRRDVSLPINEILGTLDVNCYLTFCPL